MDPVSIVLEWEQSRRQELQRSRRMLTRLAEEVRSLQGQLTTPVELIVCAGEATLPGCRDFVLGELGALPDLFDVRFLAGGDADYYAMKNQGAAQARGALIVTVDSDVVPEPGWLGNLLAPFEDPEVQVVGGNSYVEPTSTYNRAFALTWIFPVRSRDDGIGPISRLAPNNLAMRREAAARYPYPSMPESSRGSCQVLHASLARRGVKMVTSNGARVGHPAPEGIRLFALRAFSRGRDRLLFAERGSDRTLRGTGRRLRGDIGHAGRRVFRHHDEVGLGLAATPTAFAIASTFAFCCALGELLTLVNRDFMVGHFRV